MSNAKWNEGNGNEGNGVEWNVVLPEVTDQITKQSLTPAKLKCGRGNCAQSVSKLQHLYIWWISLRELLSSLLAKAALQLLVISNLCRDSLRLMGPVWRRGEQVDVECWFLASYLHCWGDTYGHQGLHSRQWELLSCHYLWGFPKCEWSISLAAVKPVPFKPEPPDIWRSWILWTGKPIPSRCYPTKRLELEPWREGTIRIEFTAPGIIFLMICISLTEADGIIHVCCSSLS